MLITERVRFLMPQSREYQFAAMAVLQQFVNGFTLKCARGEVAEEGVAYALDYVISGMHDNDLLFFIRPHRAYAHTSLALTLSLMPLRELSGPATMEVDMSDERLESLRSSGKHIVQIGGLMCGILTPALPECRRVEIRRGDPVWLWNPTCEELQQVKDFEVTGVIAWRGAATYMAAVLGLAVVELDRPDYPNWITKWRLLLYRRVEVPHGESAHDVQHLIDGARESVESCIAGDCSSLRTIRRRLGIFLCRRLPMSVLGGSSRSRAGVESDGTHAVVCYSCRQTIARTTQSFTRVLCAICEASEQGKELTLEALNSYNASRMVMSGVSMLVLEEKQPVLPGLKKFSIGDVGEGIVRAIGFLGRRKPDRGSAFRATGEDEAAYSTFGRTRNRREFQSGNDGRRGCTALRKDHD